MDCSPLGLSVHGIFQARILEWGAISFSRGSSPLKDQTLMNLHFLYYTQILYHCTTWEALARGRIKTKELNVMEVK